MKLLILFFMLGSFHSIASGEKRDTDKKQDNYLLMISIDGFQANMLWDRLAPIPSIRALAREGSWAAGLRPSNPTLTWPNHTTLVTGVNSSAHHVLFNGKVEKGIEGLPVRINPRMDKADLTHAITLYDAGYHAGLKTADVNWPVTRNAGTLHDSFPDVPDNVGNMTPDLQWEIFEEGILEDMTTFALWQHSSAGRDAVWLSTAIHLIENRMPHILLLHFLHLDNTLHRSGIQSEAGYSALALVDYQINDLLKALDLAGIREHTTIFLVSDHGFASTARTILPNVILANAGLLERSEDDQVLGGKAQAIAVGGFASVFLNDPNDSDTANRVKKLFEETEGIYSVLTPDQYADHDLPHPAETDQIGELVLFSEPGYGLSSSLYGEMPVVDSSEHGFSLAHHGFHSDFSQMNGIFIASGFGIKKGVELGVIDNTSVAPTAAHILRLDLPDSEGLVLQSILKDSLSGKITE